MKHDTKLQAVDFCYEVNWNGGSKLFTNLESAECVYEEMLSRGKEPVLLYDGPDGFKELR